MTTTMCEVPGPEFDSFLSGAAESNTTGTLISGVVGSGTGHELARVAPTNPSRVAGTTTAAGTSVQD
jgi:hypothetical protein